MPNQALEQVVEQIKRLSLKEQLEIRNLLNEISLTAEEIDKKLQAELLAEGLVSEIKPSHLSLAKQNFKPIEIIGKPISETIIEERR
ncbi:MAG: hypothetical protein WAQ98_26435 [Blastocatellia bacterium]